MSQAFETYEQFCFEKKCNVIVEEHFLEDGRHFLICRHHEKCSLPECPSLKRLHELMNSLKTFEK